MGDNRDQAVIIQTLVLSAPRYEEYAVFHMAYQWCADQCQCTRNTGISAATRTCWVAPPKIICRSRLWV